MALFNINMSPTGTIWTHFKTNSMILMNQLWCLVLDQVLGPGAGSGSGLGLGPGPKSSIGLGPGLGLGRASVRAYYNPVSFLLAI